MGVECWALNVSAAPSHPPSSILYPLSPVYPLPPLSNFCPFFVPSLLFKAGCKNISKNPFGVAATLPPSSYRAILTFVMAKKTAHQSPATRRRDCPAHLSAMALAIAEALATAEAQRRRACSHPRSIFHPRFSSAIARHSAFRTMHNLLITKRHPVQSCLVKLIHSSINPLIHQSTHPCIHSSMHPTIHSSNHPFIHSSIHPFIHSSIHPSIHEVSRP